MAEKLDNRTVLAMMAHPDDAEFLCAGALIRLAGLGWDVHIASATPGDCGTMTETPWAIAGRRTEEARQAAAIIGATYHCLDERDGLVTYGPEAIRKTCDLFRRIAPSLVFTHAPRDYMLDHDMASQLARGASFLHGAPNASAFPLKQGTCVPHLYYCDPIEGNDPITGEPVAPTTWVDISDQLEKKSQMLAAHASQRQWLLDHHGMDEYLESMKRHATMRGQHISSTAAETFVQHRGHPYPQNDILKELFTA